MESEDFNKLYSETYLKLGVRLSSSDRATETEIQAAERRLGVKIPHALRQYYLTAGHEQSLNKAFNRLISLDDLEVHHGKFPFMSENQWAVVWAVDMGQESALNPLVYQGPVVKGEAKQWFQECDHCSAFLIFMLHLQAAYGGGLPFRASGQATLETKSKLDADWHFAGEVNGMRTYSKEEQAVCFLKWPDFLTKKECWKIFAGATTSEKLASIQQSLEISWET